MRDDTADEGAPYERLEAWRLSYELALAVYRTTKTFPDDERFGLRSQARRAAYSVTANIVEGHAKRGAGDFKRFLNIAIGSIAELRLALRMARDLGYMDRDAWRQLDSVRDVASRKLWGLYRSVDRNRD